MADESGDAAVTPLRFVTAYNFSMVDRLGDAAVTPLRLLRLLRKDHLGFAETVAELAKVGDAYGTVTVEIEKIIVPRFTGLLAEGTTELAELGHAHQAIAVGIAVQSKKIIRFSGT